MRCKYNVTFEFDEASSETVSGTMEATGVQTIAARALREAKRQKPNLKWRSLVYSSRRLTIRLDSHNITVWEIDHAKH